MGIFDALKRKTPLEKAAKAVKEPYSQPEYRKEAMDKLFEMGSREAYQALLNRFTVSASGQIADEEEKRALVDRLVEVGDSCIVEIKEFIRSEQAILFPIQALCRILSKDDALQFLIDTLQQYEPLDHRSTQAKNTLLTHVTDMADPEHASVFLPYLNDHDDDVQFNAIVALEKLAPQDFREPLARVCCGDDHSQRIQRRAAAALMELGWNVKPFFGDFNEELKAEFLLGKKGVLARKHS